MSDRRSEYRIDAPGKVTGRTLFSGDVLTHNLLHGKVMFSGRAHARMISMDISSAIALPGVVAILTAKDVPTNEYGLTIKDQPVLVGLGSRPFADYSLWEGDQVAVVIAESVDIAEEAMALIEIEWEDLPVLTDPLVSMTSDVVLHRELDTNARTHYKIRKGDMEVGWAKADVIVEGTYHLPAQEHAFLQPEAGVGLIDKEGRVTVIISGQWTHEDQEQVAHALNLPLDMVRIKYPAIGGAFGGKEDMSLQIVLALAALQLKELDIHRPVRIIWSREESIIGHHKRHPGVIQSKWGATRDGILTAIESKVVLDAGAYNYTTNKVLGNAHMMVAGPYAIPNAKIDSYGVYTNNTPSGAFRGFGGPQGAFAAELQMNKLAEVLAIDPVELRLKNVLRDGVPSVTQTPLPKGVSLDKVIRRCAQEFGWDKGIVEDNLDWDKDRLYRSFQTLPPDPENIRRGRGFACAFKNVGFSFGFPEQCEATIRLYGRATVERAVLFHSGADVGQGAHTVFRQMTAQALGLDPDSVEVVASDTASSGNSGSSSASRMTFMAGNAIRGAASKALEAWIDEDRPAEGSFRYVPPPTTAYDPETGKSDPNFSYGYVAEAVQIAVDIETGHIVVERVVCADDVGKAMNTNLIEGQIEGAVVQAHGYAITENLRSSEGKIMNPRLSTYLIPGVLDIPAEVTPVILEESDPLGPWGARGMAEMPFIPYAPAVASALHDATGVWFHAIPLTPERVVAGLRKHGFDQADKETE